MLHLLAQLAMATLVIASSIGLVIFANSASWSDLWNLARITLQSGTIVALFWSGWFAMAGAPLATILMFVGIAYLSTPLMLGAIVVVLWCLNL